MVYRAKSTAISVASPLLPVLLPAFQLLVSVVFFLLNPRRFGLSVAIVERTLSHHSRQGGLEATYPDLEEYRYSSNAPLSFNRLFVREGETA